MPTEEHFTPVRNALTLGVAVGIFGISFGVLGVAAGLSAVQTCLLSVLVFAGGSQFAAVGVLAAGGSPLAAVASGLLLNTRYAAFGAVVAPALSGGRLRRALAAHLVIDESSALAMAEPTPARAERAFWLTGAAVFVLWNLGTLLGAVAGGVIGDPEAFGLDAALPGGFLALLVPTLRSRAATLSAVCGAAIALVLLPAAPPGVPVLASAAGALAGLAWGRVEGSR